MSQTPPIVPRIGKKPRSLGIKEKKMTVGMATYDDYDGVYFTVQAIRLYHPEVTDDTEILIIDNNPGGPCSQPLQDLAKRVEGVRYVPYGEVRSTAVRDLVFRKARSPYVLCLDSHVLMMPGAIKRLVTYFEAHPDCQDLLQGPLVRDDLTGLSTHFNPVWSHGMYGVWGKDERAEEADHEPFEIPMQGMGVFACCKDAWLGFNPRFIGFGGEEGYIHEKFRQAGQRTLCLPFLRWVHRFNRPLGLPYRNIWGDRVRNYLLGFNELNQDTQTAEAHFRKHLGEEVFERMRLEVCEELVNPFFYFEAIYCINLDSETGRWQAIQERFKRLGILHRVRRFSAIETPESHHIGCALSHRKIIEQAQEQQLCNVLVFEDDTIFLEDTLMHLDRSVTELKTQNWNVFHLGGHRWGCRFPKTPGCCFLESPCKELTCTHALAYNYTVYQRILDDLPDDVGSMKDWLSVNFGIDQYLRMIEGRYLAFPVVASQPSLLVQEDEANREHFIL